ncbi:MAG: TolC family protein, partial [Flavobacteriales bacterium]|nr:TolC family protein [Flavobacteriales bacterium]
MREIPMPRPTDLLTSIGLVAMLALSSCVPALKVREVRRDMPATFGAGTDSISSAARPWAQFHGDPDLRALIDTALANNQEINIMLQEIEVLRNEARARKGEYLPFVG